MASATPVRVASVALAVAVTAASAQFTMPLPFTAVPFTFTPMAVVLTAAVLGARLGAVTQVLYVLLGAAGLAVFSPSALLPPGALRLVGPTGGYLMAYPLAAFVSGWLTERGWDRRYLTSAAAMLLGLGVIYLGGVSWLTVAYTHSVPAAITMGLAQFVVLDVLKIAAAALVLPRAWRFIGRRA
jgi:biotin transport system substrate-specific component